MNVALQTSGGWSVIDEEGEKIRIRVFDCRIGIGKGSWRRTVIAAQTKTDVISQMNGGSPATLDL